MNNKATNPHDESVPTLLLVSLIGVLAAVGGIVGLAQTSAAAALVAAVFVLLAGTALVTMTIGRQLDDVDGRVPVDAAPSDDPRHAA